MAKKQKNTIGLVQVVAENEKMIRAKVKEQREARQGTAKEDVPCVYMVRWGRSAPVPQEGKPKASFELEVVCFNVQGCHAQPAFIKNLQARGMILVDWDLPSVDEVQARLKTIADDLNANDGAELIGRDMISEKETLKSYTQLVAYCKNEAGKVFSHILETEKLKKVASTAVIEHDKVLKEKDDLKKRVQELEKQLSTTDVNKKQAANKAAEKPAEDEKQAGV